MKVLTGLFLAFLCLAARGSEYLAPLELGPTNTYGRDLQRSMRLIVNSPVQKKRTVKVLLYGQSVTQEIWTVWLTDYLLAKYPNAHLVVTNLAVGYNAEFLSKLAAVDIPGFYPDLMIFHNYGGLSYYEQEIAVARRQTIADILIQTDHVHLAEDLNEPTDPLTPGGLPENAYRNYVALPDIAHRYGAELGLIRTYWKRFIQDYNIPTESLLRDHIHPNAQGSFLMAELLKPYLRADESFESTTWNEAEKNYVIGRDVDWVDDTLTLNFTGNRVDVIAEETGTSPVEVRIDGRKPSEFPELYRFTRSDWYPKSAWLSILQISSRTPLIEEDWTARITQFTTNNGVPFARFTISGSKTGFDGEGSITERFVSNSGRVIIESLDWLMFYWAAAYYPLLQPLPVGHEIHWKSQFNGQDEFVPQVNDPTLESTTTLVQGIGNGPHTLTLKRHGPVPISGLRVFNPLARTQPRPSTPPAIVSLRRENETCLLTLNVSGRYILESSTDGRVWLPLTAPITDQQATVNSAEHLRLFRVRALD